MSDAIIIQLIADYGVGDPAFGEVVQKFTYLDKSIRVSTTSVPAFSTVATGIWVAQFATVNAFPGLIVFSNTAPRKILKGFDESVDGGRLIYTKLTNGTVLIAVNAGYSLSFLRNEVKKLHAVNVPNVGSQFRSRDYYPDAVVGIAHGQVKYIGGEIPVSTIPHPPNNLIGFVDGYGNLKTTLRSSKNTLAVGTKIAISCNGLTHEGVISDETYKVKDGEFSFAPGSTGGNDRFMEIWVRGGSAWDAFGKPHIETEFSIHQI